MAKAKKLPSGSWRVRVTHTGDDGVQHVVSFTDENPKVAEAKAAMWKAGMLEKEMNRRFLPLGDAIDAYIETGRCTGMSPATIRAHVSSRNNAFTTIIEKRINKLTLRDIQSWINVRAQEVAPKTVKNNLDLLIVVLKQNEISLNWDALRLPKRKAVEPEVPSDAQVTAMINDLRANKNNDMFIAVMLASLYGLRRSEICALTWQDIQTVGDPEHPKHVLVINKALVRDENNLLVEKDTKTDSGERTISLSDPVYAELIRRRNTIASTRTNIISLSPNALTNRYATLAKKYGVCTKFHVLRHYMASVMARENVHTKYAAKILGHASPSTTERIYTHVMDDKIIELNDALDAHAAGILGN